ncbi:MAG: Glu/Leu/Phe/Val dehydrogenase [Clostridia bacterium]|nr:Glu/Leu/Phe/Val dehydrogenase [Clostridia bacterium]
MKPYIIVEWNDTLTDAHGWMCVHNYVNGFAGGGIRMHPTVTKEEVMRLAKGMAYKYQAAESTTTGGCKSGIVYDSHKPDAYDVLKRFITAIRPYVDLGLGIGGDLGVSYDDVLRVFKELGMRVPATRSQMESEICRKGIMDTDRLLEETKDGFPLNDVVTGYGVAYAADEAWRFRHKDGKVARVVVQGFGCVGASCAYLLEKMGYKVIGIADAKQLVLCEDGLDTKGLIAGKNKFGEMDPKTFKENYRTLPNSEWLSVECDILIPAALEDVINKGNASCIRASLIVEGANIPVSLEGDEILKEKRVEVVPDFIANLGAIRFFDRVLYGLIDPSVEGVLFDIEDVCRRNVRRIFEEADHSGAYQRDIALKLFEPTIQTEPEF